ncbi:hypothetical protein [Zongyangia hominis]|uniref:Uncharacterized protein n=1 Tax=Zongyangia hominis TaxID=2763677 RepID=A0A926EET1_9FIRM|nr:hypothetical protein [Zongyangia hominis]MBC8570756.1 hypothetical protein [Zongyangia hominis]
MKDILDILADQCGCFISALKYSENLPRTIAELRALDLSRYSLTQCNEALSYLFNENFSFSTHQEVKNYLAGK